MGTLYRAPHRGTLLEALELRRLFAGVLSANADIGSPTVAGSYSYADGTHSLNGSGDIGGAADALQYAWNAITQDFSVTARVGSLAAADSNAKAGVMIRGSAAAGAPMAALVVTSGLQLSFIYRLTTNAAAGSFTVPGGATPEFVRLSRSGFTVAGSYSNDGVAWTPLGTPQRVTFDSGLTLAGVAVASGNNPQPASATFTNVALLGNGTDWNTGDVGTPGTPGSAIYDASGGRFTLLAGGTGVGGTSDSVEFASKSLNGDGTVAARLGLLADNAEAGVMIRASGSADASFAAVLGAVGGGVRFVWRSAAGMSTQSISVAGIAQPVSLKLVRGGNAVQGYYSDDDGATWTRIGTGAAPTIALPTTAQAGLVASANAAGTAVTTATFTGVSIGATPSPGAGILTSSDETFLDDLSRRTANWFVAVQNTTSGLFPDRANVSPGWLGGDASMASTGFGLTALAIASSRGWISDGYTRALRTLTFLWNDADMKNPANHGYFYHFVDQTTGVRSGTSELSSIDTALLISGVLTAGQYWKGTDVATLAQQIYNRVDWTYMQPDGAGTELRMAWTPESGFSSARWDSWSEGPLLYLLAMGSATHPINAASWLSFPRNQSVTTYAGMTFYHASGSPLFTNQYPQGWFDLRNTSDRADADPTAAVVHMDPYLNSRKHTLAQRLASIAAAAGTDVRYDYYGANAWGLTASDSATGYKVFGGPPLNSNVDGTIAPTAPGGSLAFTPRESIDDLANLKATYPLSYKTYGFVDAFNPRPSVNWYDPDAIGIDQGMLLVAAENLRSGFVWQNFMADPAAQRAVSLAFTPSPSLAPPSITTSAFAYETAAQSLSFSFAQDVADSLSLGDLTVKNLTTGQILSASDFTLSRSGAGKPTTATINFFTPLADGNYELRIGSNAVGLSDGTANASDLVVPFFVLGGDANHDGRVNFDDLVILAQNYNKTGLGFSGGNFNYSTDGKVDFDDLVILAQHYNQTLAAPTPMAIAASVSTDASLTHKSHHRAEVITEVI